MSADIKSLSFPALPDYSATWAQISFEPLLGSGECLTLGVAALADDGEIATAMAFNPEALKCIWGEHAATALQAAEITLQALEDHLRKYRRFDGFVPPLKGVKIQRVKYTQGASLSDILRRGLTMTASFAAYRPDAEAMRKHHQVDEVDHFPKMVQNLCPDLEKGFNRTFRIHQGARESRIDYAGVKLAANFGRLSPGRLAQGVGHAKIKLWDLDVIKTAVMFPADNHELILLRPRTDDPLYNDRDLQRIEEAVQELVAEGDAKHLSVFPVTSPEQAADRILLREAA